VELASLNRRVLLALGAAGAAALLVLAALALIGRGGSRAVRVAPIPDATAPRDTRIRVQVLNASRVRGLARRATLHLRDRGFDVVEIGTTAQLRDSTLVLDRSGHPAWAALAAKAMGGAHVEARPDSSRYLDVTVLVGATWRPPAEPFYP
jgi:hypothetical protein